MPSRPSLQTAANIFCPSPSLPLSGIKEALAVMIAIFGLAASLITGVIIRRQHQWSAWYVVKYHLLPSYRETVFPVPPEKLLKAKTVGEMPSGIISTCIQVFCGITGVFWFLIALAVPHL